jgi:hypothetical protein
VSHVRPRSLRQNLDIRAVRNAVVERWSNGQTEGQINRLKTLKRAMFGRADTELLRARLLPIGAITEVADDPSKRQHDMTVSLFIPSTGRSPDFGCPVGRFRQWLQRMTSPPSAWQCLVRCAVHSQECLYPTTAMMMEACTKGDMESRRPQVAAILHEGSTVCRPAAILGSLDI